MVKENQNIDYKAARDEYLECLAKNPGVVSVIELGNFDNQEINLMGTKVILNVNDDMEVMKNEGFGPLLPLMTFEK